MDILEPSTYSLLTDFQILERLVSDDERCIFVSPLGNPTDQLGPASLDIHLGPDLLTTRVINHTSIDLTKSGESAEQRLKRYNIKRSIGPSEHFVLHPGEFTLASTLEFFRLPLDIAARLEGRSSIGRLGLQVHATAGFVDPGFEGTLTFELINSGRLPVKLAPGIRLGQICFFETQHATVGYMDKKHSKYGGRLGTEMSRIYDDPEVGKK